MLRADSAFLTATSVGFLAFFLAIQGVFSTGLIFQRFSSALRATAKMRRNKNKFNEKILDFIEKVYIL